MKTLIMTLVLSFSFNALSSSGVGGGGGGGTTMVANFNNISNPTFGGLINLGDRVFPINDFQNEIDFTVLGSLGGEGGVSFTNQQIFETAIANIDEAVRAAHNQNIEASINGLLYNNPSERINESPFKNATVLDAKDIATIFTTDGTSYTPEEMRVKFTGQDGYHATADKIYFTEDFLKRNIDSVETWDYTQLFN